VLEHRESRERQYALAGVAAAWGWPPQRILVIDEDQGHSGRKTDSRAGFRRLAAEITMNHVGVVLGLEMSRLARSHTDWHQLFELCAVFGTLLADEDGAYDAQDPNDRLLLGLKGMISEVELHTMRCRLERGRQQKAARGELFLGALPWGYVRSPAGGVELDPDEQVRASVRLVFDKFEERGSVYGVLHYLVAHGLRLAARASRGPHRGQVGWRRPTRSFLSGVLRHPLYAGAYAYGRRRRDPRGRSAEHPHGGLRSVPRDQWPVLILGRYPAYITWERYMENQERMRRNQARPGTPGAPRRGAALLAGLLVCGGCGRRMGVNYRAGHQAYYQCGSHYEAGTAATCSGLTACAVDDLVVAQVLRVLQPAGLDLSLKAVENIQEERMRLDQHWRQQVEQARYEAERAERQYQAVEPENRLVARTLEGRWEEALREQRRLQEEYDRFLRQQPPELSAAERARVRALAEDIPALWDAPSTTAADRKEVLRCLVERVVVAVTRTSERVGVTIHWQGGAVSQHEASRTVQTYEQLHDYAALLERLQVLRGEGWTAAQMAERLNGEGFGSPRRRGRFSREMVRQLLSRRGLANERRGASSLGAGEWWLSDLARALDMPRERLREWVRRGWVRGRQTPVQGLWVAWADQDEVRRLRKLARCWRRGCLDYPVDLITTKITKGLD
jgi:DNA invertase Pin-like site-specific DNA recombinase